MRKRRRRGAYLWNSEHGPTATTMASAAREIERHLRVPTDWEMSLRTGWDLWRKRKGGHGRLSMTVKKLFLLQMKTWSFGLGAWLK